MLKSEESAEIFMAETEFQRKQATRALDPVAPERAFYFYAEIGQPLGRSADSLEVFADIVSEIDVSSVKFHLERGDFENWFRMIGDPILSERVAELRGTGRSATELRSKVSSGVRSRIVELRKTSQPKRQQQQQQQQSPQHHQQKTPQKQGTQPPSKTQTSSKKSRAPS
jgi:hypothetical protein